MVRRIVQGSLRVNKLLANALTLALCMYYHDLLAPEIFRNGQTQGTHPKSLFSILKYALGLGEEVDKVGK